MKVLLFLADVDEFRAIAQSVRDEVGEKAEVLQAPTAVDGLEILTRTEVRVAVVFDCDDLGFSSTMDRLPFLERLTKELGLPVIVVNDRAPANSYAKFGAWKTTSHQRLPEALHEFRDLHGQLAT